VEKIPWVVEEMSLVVEEIPWVAVKILGIVETQKSLVDEKC
jgi:hypothetical protein